MTIEKEIKQNKFTNVYQKLALNMLYSYKQLEFFIKQQLIVEDITMQQFNILRILRGSMPSPLSTLQIRERMLDKMSDTSRIVDRLVLKKFVTKKISSSDNRLVEVLITDKGLRLLKKLDVLDKKFAAFFSNITEVEAAQLSNLLDKVNTAA